MIVVIIADPQSGKAQFTFEGGTPEMAHELMYNMTDNFGQQLGKPPLKKKTSLIIPATVVPTNPGGQQ